MADNLRLQEWHSTQAWIDEKAGVGLGQVNIGILATDPQPVHSNDGQLTAVFFGELYYAESLRRQASAQASDAELILHLYETQGEQFINALEGVFVLAVWDAGKGSLLVANDRFGLLPTYYACYDGQLVFAPQMQAILADPAFDGKLDMTALAQFMRFQRLLGDRTFFEKLHLLPYGSLLTFSIAKGDIHVAHYWDFDKIPAWQAGTNFDDAVVEAGRLLRRSVETRVKGSQHLGVYLSGGLDSRTLAGFASQVCPSIVTLTYGVPNCRDVYYAGRIARRLKTRHHFFPLADGKWLRCHLDTHLKITEGFTTWTHSHAAVTLEPARGLMEINLTGYGGDQVLGGRALDYAPLLISAPDDIAVDCQAFAYLNQRFSWPGITEAEERYLYTPETFAAICGQALESMKRELNHFRLFPAACLWDFFCTIYQGTRLSNLNVLHQRAFFEARYPFYDYALVDWIYSMPLEHRLSDRLYLAVINREIPRVTWVPRDINDQLLTDHRLIRQAHGQWQKVRRYITGRQRRSIHEDPEGWLRHDLRDWAESLLFSRRTLERGIFNPAFLHSIFERHMSGREIHTIGKIAPIMTYEMMLRRFFDGSKESV